MSLTMGRCNAACFAWRRVLGVLVLGVLVLGVLTAACGRAEAAPGAAAEAPAAATVAAPAGVIEWVRIEGGPFQADFRDGVAYEEWKRRSLMRTFELARSEVTVAQYRACVEAGRCPTPIGQDTCNWGVAGRETHPINCVTWSQALDFARWVGARLPSEAEWAFAARSGGREQRFPWGEAEPTCERAVMDEGNGPGCGAEIMTAPVCSRAGGHSAHGVCDLLGNVAEWVERGDPLEAGAQAGGAATPESDRFRISRGGSGLSTSFGPWENRDERRRHDLSDGLGFRVARSIALEPVDAEAAVRAATAAQRAWATDDYEALLPLLERPTVAGRGALRAFVQAYEGGSVMVAGARVVVPEVPELEAVKQALARVPVLSSAPPEALGERAAGVGIEWVRIEGGTFQMGSTLGADDEKPVRVVNVPTFEMAKTEVTVRQFRACMEAGGCSGQTVREVGCDWERPERDDHPIRCVDWVEASRFARWAGGRLPSEAEWEYAARSGGRDQRFPWGERTPSHRLAVMGRAPDTLPVCSKPRGNSAQGICDLLGNVEEWVADWYGPYGEAPSDGSARISKLPGPLPSSGASRPRIVAEYRSFRGGSHSSSPLPSATTREKTRSSIGTPGRGIRIVRSPVEPPEVSSTEAQQQRAALRAAQAAGLQAAVEAHQARATADFAAIRSRVDQPKAADREALEGYLKAHENLVVVVAGERASVEVPEVEIVQRALALAKAGGLPAAPGGPAVPPAKPAGPADPPAIEWVRIEGGTFMMGSDLGEAPERPRRQVSVPAFELMKAEVTNAQYQRCVAAGACTSAGYDRCLDWDSVLTEWVERPVATASYLRQDQHPVVCVTWAQASAFARWAKGRLPSEAEWEFAARSRGREQRYPWGDTRATCVHTTMDEGRGMGCNQGETTKPVCSKPKGNSAEGVCDLAGNAWEWVADWFGPYGEAPTDGSPRTQVAEQRVRRGGGWSTLALYVRAAHREQAPPGFRGSTLGFRLAR